jgi:hypothetical protein
MRSRSVRFFLCLYTAACLTWSLSPQEASATPVIKRFSATGSVLEYGAFDAYPLWGRLVYRDPDKATDNVLSDNAIVSLDLYINGFSLTFPFEPPPASHPNLAPEISIVESGKFISVDMTVYDDYRFDESGSAIDAEWWYFRGDYVGFQSGLYHDAEGSIAWLASPGTCGLVLLGAGLMARRLRHHTRKRRVLPAPFC